jgi:NAD(P)-dependent dehydrogenase (short-subunit alcohol dehydrogenase family)
LFAQEGANVVLVDINLEGAQKCASIIAERFPNVRAIATKADVGKEADVKAAVDLAVREFGRVDVMASQYMVIPFTRNRCSCAVSGSSIMLVSGHRCDP